MEAPSLQVRKARPTHPAWGVSLMGAPEGHSPFEIAGWNIGPEPGCRSEECGVETVGLC